MLRSVTPQPPSRSARSVHVVDTLPENCKIIDGSLETTWPVLAEGSSVNASYVVQFTSGGTILLPLAKITYMAEDKSKQASMRITSCAPTTRMDKRMTSNIACAPLLTSSHRLGSRARRGCTS